MLISTQAWLVQAETAYGEPHVAACIPPTRSLYRAIAIGLRQPAVGLKGSKLVLCDSNICEVYTAAWWFDNLQMACEPDQLHKEQR